MIEGGEVTSPRGAVAAEMHEAARIGARALAAGGNAMDAIAAASLACSVLGPDKCGIGGYVMAAVVLEGASGEVWSLDANARAPSAAHAGMYPARAPEPGRTGINESEYDCSVDGDVNVYGPLAVAVPGQMAGMGTLWERWGRLDWPAIVAPSQALVSDGFPFGHALSRNVRGGRARMESFPETEAFFMPDGEAPVADTVWHPPHLDRTLARLASAGWRDFYEGELAGRIADYLTSQGGILTRKDLKEYAPRTTKPYRATYRGIPVYGPVLPNGALSGLQALQMLDCLEPQEDGSVMYWHQMAEVMKQVWRDRLRYLGDPRYADVPLERLLSPEYAAGRAEALRHHPEVVDKRPFSNSGKPVLETTHLSAADGEGNVVTATITQGGGLGSYVTVPETGILLSHGMCRLDPRPGLPNSVAGGKGPLNNIVGLVARLPDRDVATGLPGGRRIVSVGTQAMQRVIDFGASSRQASAAPRLHVLGQEPLEVTRSISDEVVAGLRAMGHEVEVVERCAGPAQDAEFLRNEGLARAGTTELAAAPD